MIASFLFSKVRLRLLAPPEVSIARPPALVDSIVPELVIFRSVDAPFQSIAGFFLSTDSLPPASTVTVSVPDTVLAAVSVVPARTG